MIVDLDFRSPDSYRQFLAIRRLPRYGFQGRSMIVPDEYAHLIGLEAGRADEIDYTPSPFAYDYQDAITRMALNRRKFAAFVDCGLGKTLMILEYSRYVRDKESQRVLIVAPLMVCEQTVDEYGKFYTDGQAPQYIPAAMLQSWLNGHGPAIGITNYESIREGLVPGNLGALVLDECFPKGTKVLVSLDGTLGNTIEKAIEDIRVGDYVVNASGVDRVIKTKRKKVRSAVAFTAGKRVVSSPNHPVFTKRGWVCAQDLRPGDSVLLSDSSLRILRGDFQASERAGAESVLRSILLSEMANEYTGARLQSSQPRSTQENRYSEVPMVRQWLADGGEGEGADAGPMPYEMPRSTGENFEDTESHEAQTFRAWWEWSRLDCSAEDLEGCTVRDLGSGICCIAGPTSARVSDMLQARLSESRNDDGYRSGWVLPQSDEASGAGQEEGFDACFVRVDRLEILESGNLELEDFRDVDGELHFYDIEAEQHPSFSVAGLLVHNSSFLKSAYGAWGTRLIELGKGLKWKFSLTGTPAPNDRIEFANQAVFLDQHRTVNAFLARYFVNRGETANRWELKPHALKPFYRDLSSWCIFLSDPTVYGWRSMGDIPPIHTHIEDVPLTFEQSMAVDDLELKTCRYDKKGRRISKGGIGKRSKLSQIGKGSYEGQPVGTLKYDHAQSRVDSWPEESTIIWCRYNYEQDEMEKKFPGCASIHGSTPYEKRRELIADFVGGRRKVLISKAKVLGFGLNLQIATRHYFSSCEDSFESFYQCVKRSNRIGSTKPLNVHIAVTEIERPMMQNVLDKRDRIDADTRMQEELFKTFELAKG